VKKGDGKKLNQAGEGNWKSVENVKLARSQSFIIVRARFTAKGRPFPDAATPKGKLHGHIDVENT
jgi:hypothetical protein